MPVGRVPGLACLVGRQRGNRAQEYGESHITAEKAIQVLREESLVVTVIGRGTIVAKPE